MKRPEQALHQQVAQILNAILPPEVWWCHIPNGGWRTKVEAAILKSMGVKAGVPDLLFIYQGQASFIELKAPGKPVKLRQTQSAAAEHIKRSGAPVGFASDFIDVLRLLRLFGIPHKYVDLGGR